MARILSRVDLCTGDLFLQLELFLAELGFYLEGIVREGGRDCKALREGEGLLGREEGGREERGRVLHSWEEVTITLLVKPQSFLPL